MCVPLLALWPTCVVYREKGIRLMISFAHYGLFHTGKAGLDSLE